MEDNSDPVIAFRKQKNRTWLQTHLMTLNPKSIRIVRMLESLINSEAYNIEGLKRLLILYMFDI